MKMFRSRTFCACALSLVCCVADAQMQPPTYTVAAGDTLWKISRRYGVSVDALKKTNHLTSDLIHPGQRLSIPTVAATQPPKTVTPPPPPPPPAQTAAATPKPRVTPVQPRMAPEIAAATPATSKLADRLLAETRAIAKQKVKYNGSWKPPGGSEKLVMDCSNTVRYIFARATGVTLPRTASDQYYELRLKNRVWAAPLDARGKPDTAWIWSTVQTGDLLFWEHTYKPKRNPPVTHVMIYVGKDARGRHIMVGSEVGGAIEPPVGASGPNVYEFDPHSPSGGYRTGFFGKRINGRFASIGRPLDSAK